MSFLLQRDQSHELNKLSMITFAEYELNPDDDDDAHDAHDDDEAL